MKSIILSTAHKGTIVLVTYFLLCSNSFAFFHSNKVPECNDERLGEILGEIIHKKEAALFLKFIKVKSVRFYQIRQEIYDKENQRRRCSGSLDMQYELQPGIETTEFDRLISKPLTYNVNYDILGTSDGEVVELIEYR